MIEIQMSNPNHPSEKEIFFEALEKDTPDQRAAYLDDACRGDLELRKRVEDLLAKHFQQDDFMKQPAVEDSSAASPRAPLPGGPVGADWSFSGNRSGDTGGGSPDQSWQWNASPIG